jgi:hypothetical protein
LNRFRESGIKHHIPNQDLEVSFELIYLRASRRLQPETIVIIDYKSMLML